MSTIRVDNFGPSAGGTTYSARGIAKAWVNFNGTGTIAARDSENVSSLTDVAVGKFTISISSAMSDTNYVVNCSCADTTTTDQAAFSGSSNFSPDYTTSSYRIGGMNFTGNIQDKIYNFSVVFGDLA